MTPHLTSRGAALLVLAGAWWVAGVASGRVAVLVAGHVLVVLVAGAYLAAVARLRRLRRGDLHLAMEARPAGRSGASGVGDRLLLSATLGNRGAVGLARVRLAPAVGSGVRLRRSGAEIAWLHPGTLAEVEWEADAVRTGSWTLHGAAVDAEDTLGLVRVAVWAEARSRVRVLPRRSLVTAAGVPPGRVQQALGAAGAHRARRRGDGTELRELRGYQPGDSYRSIAWKASARRRTLMVREFDDEVVTSTAVLLDISSTMRSGPNGEKLEAVLGTVADYFAAVMRARDRAAFFTFDESLHGVVPLGTGISHHRRLTGHLLSVNTVVHEALTEWTDGEVAEALADHLLVSAALEFRRHSDPGSPVDVDLLVRWIRERLDEELDDAGVERPPQGSLVLSQGEILRLFALARGVEIPYRVETRVGAKEHGLAAAIDRAVALTRDAMLLVVFTDFCGMIDPGVVRRATSKARCMRHDVVFVVPWTPDWVAGESPGAPEWRSTLHELFSLGERRERERWHAEVKKAGAHVVPMGLGSTPERVLREIEALRRRV